MVKEIKKKIKESFPAVNISTDLKKTEEITTTPTSSLVLAPPVVASKRSKVNLKKKSKIVKVTKLSTILIISMSILTLTREKLKKWKGKLAHSKEIEGDIPLLTPGKQERLKAIKTKLPMKMKTTMRLEITTVEIEIIIEKRNPISKMSRKVLENIESEREVENGNMNHKNSKTIIKVARNIQSGEKTGAHGSEQRPSEVTVAAITLMITKVLMTSNQKEDKSTDQENLEETMTVIMRKTTKTILPKDKSLTPKQVNQ